MFTKFIRIACLFFVPILLSLQLLFAQGSGSISGRVLDNETGDPLIGANVIIENTSLGINTDLDGKFMLHGVPDGKWILKVSYIGYAALNREVTVEAGSTLAGQEFRLSAQAITGEAIIVTAQAHGQLAAINQQLSSNTITNVVAAEKIHELPDENAATALSRLPGLSLMGTQGDQVVIRGIQAKENIILLNGVQLPSTDMNDRSTNLGFISSNMLSGIEVTKVLTPDMDANAIGGVVNLRLREAPEGFHSDVLTQGIYNGQDRTLPVKDNYQVWASASDRFFDNSLGVFVQGNARQTNGGNDYASATFQAMGQGAIAPYGQETYGMQQFSFNDEVNIVKNYGGSVILDYLYPSGKILVQSSVAFTNNDLARHRDLSSIADGRREYTISRDIHKKVLLISGLQGENTFSELGNLKVDYGVAHSLSTKRTDLRYGDAADNPGFDFSSAQLAFHQFTQDDQLNLTLNDAYHFPFITDDYTRATVEQFAATRYESYNERLTTAQLNLTQPVTISSGLTAELKMGGKMKYSDRDNDVERYNQRIVQPGSNAGALEFLKTIDTSYNSNPDLALLFRDFKNYNYTRGNYFLGGLHTMDNVVNTDYLDEYFRLASPLWHHHLADSKRNDFTGKEYITAGFAMGTFNIGTDLTLLTGVRFEHFSMDYAANFIFITHSVDGDAKILDTLNTAKRTRDDWFPNVQIRYKVTDWFDVRVAYSKTLSRPDYTAMLPSTIIDVGSNTASVGNPNLRPAVAKNVDVYFSFYNNDIGLFTVGGFYKRIDDFFFSTSRVLSALKVSGIPYPDSTAFANLHLDQLTSSGTVTAYMNNPNPGFIRGIELEWQTRFWYLPSPFNLMVLNVNYTRAFSKMDYLQIQFRQIPATQRGQVPQTVEVDTIYTTRLLNQADHVVNVALGVDYKGLSARVSYRLQGNVFTSLGTRPENDTYSGDQHGVDFTIKQQLPIDGFSLFLNGMNITHSPSYNYQDFRRVVNGPILQNLTQTLYSPSMYELGLRYNF